MPLIAALDTQERTDGHDDLQMLPFRLQLPAPVSISLRHKVRYA